MTMEKAFNSIFDKSFFKVDVAISGEFDYPALSTLDNDFFRVVFISELINFFGKEFNFDIMPLYLKYLDKCSKSFENQFVKFFEEF